MRRSSLDPQAAELPAPELDDLVVDDARRRRRARRAAASSPSTLTPPWASRRRASERETPNASASAAGRCSRPVVGADARRPRRRRGCSWSMKTRSNAACGRGRRVGAVEALDDRRAPARAWRRAATCRPAAARPRSSSNHVAIASSGRRIVLPNISSGGSVTPIWLPLRLGHLLDAVDARQDRHRQDALLRLAVGALDVAPEQQVERLVGAAELDVGAHRDRVVALHQRVEQLEDRDRRAARRSAWRSRRARAAARRSSCARGGRGPPSACRATRR